MRTLFVTLAGLALCGAAAAEDAKVVRPLDLKDLPFRSEGPFGKPVVIGTADELAKAVDDKDARDAIAKAVDFKTENLVVFAWAGSGQDRVALTVEKGEKGPVVVTTFKGGLTRDLRQHVHAYAVSKSATMK
jgi:hypothetical protein